MNLNYRRKRLKVFARDKDLKYVKWFAKVVYKSDRKKNELKVAYRNPRSHWENIENSVKLYSDNDSSENNEASISDQYEWISIKNFECSEL